MKKGSFTFVLHSHLPYCRRAGRWPHGEEWLHEALSETYLPLLCALYDLRSEGCPFHLTVGLTPVLAEQLADPLVQEHFQEFVEEQIQRAARDRERFEKQGQEHPAYLARFYLDYYTHILRAFRDRFQGDVMAAFKALQDEGWVEVLAGAATHAYLPLLERDSSIFGQLQAGKETYQRFFGRSPRSIWLPECGYRPAFYTGQGQAAYLKPGLESFLAELGIRLFFCETHTLEGGRPVGKALGQVIGPYGSIPKRYVVPLPGYREPTLKTTYLPYWVQEAQVAALGRNNRTGMQVWSADWGYPGDFDYREFHKRDGTSGLRYWKVTGARLDLAYKDYYEPRQAHQKALEHAGHYARLVDQLLGQFYEENRKPGIIAAAYDTELFGHWWFEGITWIKEVLRLLARSEGVELTTASGYLEQHPPQDVLALEEGSWGQAGTHFTWLNIDTQWMWPIVHQAELKMEELVARHPQAQGPLAEVLRQAARELLLLQSSDWPFLITTGQAREYASARFQEHAARFQRLADIASAAQVDQASLQLCREYFELDKVFPSLDYRDFANREGWHGQARGSVI